MKANTNIKEESTEQPLFIFNNKLRNTLVVIFWIFIFISSILLSIKTIEQTNYGTLGYTLIQLLYTSLGLAIIWNVRIIKVQIYIDAIVFREQGFHPLLKKSTGIVYDNIIKFKIKKLSKNQYLISFKRTNAKRFNRILSLNQTQISELSDFLLKSTTEGEN